MNKYLGSGLAILGKPVVSKNLPIHLQVEPTNKCNLKCVFCSRDKYLGELKRLPLERFEKLLSEVKPKRITFAGSGEPLLNPDLPEMVSLASRKGSTTVITTNFIKGEEFAEKLVRSGLTGLRISLDGATPETYKAIRGADCHEKILRGIKKVNKYKKELGKSTPDIGIEFVVQGRNFKEMTKMIELAKNHGVRNVNFRPLNLIGMEEKEELLQAGLEYEKYKETFKEALRLSKESGVKTNLPGLLKDISFYYNDYGKSKLPSNGKVCLHLWLQAYVSSSGELTPCCALQMDEGVSMGNVFSSSFKTVWNGKKFVEFRKDFKDGNVAYESCRTCYRVDLATLIKKTLTLPGLK